MKKVILCILTIIFSVNLIKAQENIAGKNIVYLDVGIILSLNFLSAGAGLNYERMLNDNISFRAGINIGFFGTGGSGDAISGTSIAFPLTFNFMTNNKNKFEAGFGGGPVISLKDGRFSYLPAIRAGYRYQPDENGLMLKAGLEFPSNLYLSVFGAGYSFR